MIVAQARQLDACCEYGIGESFFYFNFVLRAHTVQMQRRGERHARTYMIGSKVTRSMDYGRVVSE